MGTATRPELRYRRLFDRHRLEVYAYCRRRTDAESAADAAAETFVVAWRRIEDVPEGDGALGWLYGVARRILANEFRRTRRSRHLLERLRFNASAPDWSPEVVVVRQERDRMMLETLSRLRPEDREILRLAWWEELPHADIAVLVGCSPQAVSQRIHRAARRVAREFSRLDHGPTVAKTPRQPGGGETT